MKLVETWVKAPFLKRSSLLLLSECAQDVFLDVCKKFAEKCVVLTSCPEVENAEMIMGKLTSILTCSNPSDLTVLTMRGPLTASCCTPRQTKPLHNKVRRSSEPFCDS